MSRPNVVYLHTHDTGRWVSPYGHAAPTPNIQRFAEDGVLFRRAFSAAPTCSPSRAALLTGRSAHSVGMLGLAHLGWGLHDYRQHVIHPLHEAGYTSALIGVQHIAPGPDEGPVIGYHEQLPLAGNRAPEVAAAAVDYLGREHERPFFLSVGFVETHTLPEPGATFGYPPEDDRYVAVPPTLPDTARTRADMASFWSSARAMDAGMGAVLTALEENGLSENTIVIITTDHGVPLPGMKATLTDHGTGVMLMMRGPGLPAGSICDALVSQIDVVPTLCSLLGIDPPEWTEGVDLTPAIRDGIEVNSAVFSELTYHVCYEPARSVRTDRWRYTRRFDDRDRPTLPNIDDSPSKDVLVEAGWPQVTVPAEELVDLALDPGGAANLVGDPAHADVLEDLRAQLTAWMVRTDDPILDGPVPQPAGYPYASVDAISAEVAR
ncbi:sulfatase family protein [Ruania alba]|uniref:Arylsulfatase A n=1 Tax=Ruania alba TaxID=648782 RepID=A0A1H5K973_9MICO|nr:sulfatase [Ruania alba]SEE61423.1 Arylsulfatase A [Ruania alba]